MHSGNTTEALRDAASAEWTRLWTVRSTWWCLTAGTGLMLFIGTAAGAGHSGPEPAPVWKAAQVAMVPGQFAFLLVVLLAVTSEYGTGAIRSTLLWIPQRRVLFAARLFVPIVFTTTWAVLASVATDLVAWVLLGDAAEVIPADVAASLGRIAIVVAFGGALAVGLGLLLRNTAGTLTAIFLLMFVLVVALGNSGVRWLITISDHLPGRAVVSLLVTDDVELPMSSVAVVITGWTCTALLAGAWSLMQRDST